MTATAAWTPPRSAMSLNFGGLLDRLVAAYGVADLEVAGFQAFMDAPGDGVALLVDEPDRVPESWDLAVIFPELLAAAGASPRAAVLRPAQAPALQARFGIGRLPALLFLRDGGYVGAIEGLRNWTEFVDACREMLQRPAGRAPGIGVAVTAASAGCH